MHEWIIFGVEQVMKIILVYSHYLFFEVLLTISFQFSLLSFLLIWTLHYIMIFQLEVLSRTHLSTYIMCGIFAFLAGLSFYKVRRSKSINWIRYKYWDIPKTSEARTFFWFTKTRFYYRDHWTSKRPDPHPFKGTI